MIKKIRQRLIDSFLPMWAKETVLQENRALRLENDELKRKLEIRDAYIGGVETGIRAFRRIVINNNGGRLSSENTDK